jgi:DNA-binding GntR family transcriptional regulator
MGHYSANPARQAPVRRDSQISPQEPGLKKSKNLTLKVYNRIMKLMLDYEIVPGQRLVFVDLANQLKVSRTPVNNALSILAQEGYLDFVPNQGYSVRRLSQKDAEELYQIREVLEVGFIEQAIRNITEKKLINVEKQKLAYEKAISDRVHRNLFILDTEFHLAILDMAGNRILSARYQDLSQKIFLRFRIEELKIDRIDQICIEHHQLYEALSLRDAERAKGLIMVHHQNSRESLFPIIFQEKN